MVSKIWIIPDKCFIVPRNNTKNYLGNYWITDDKDWKRQTTGVDCVEEAKQVALERYMEIHSLAAKGIPLRSTGKIAIMFNDVAMIRRGKWMEDIADGFGKPVYKSYINVIDKWLIPYFEGVALTDVDDEKIEEFERFRRKQMGIEPAKSTINNHNCVFRAIFAEGRRKKYIQSTQIPEFTVKNKGKASKPRASFKPKEMVRLNKMLIAWRQKEKRSIARYKARLLFYYVQLLATCGIRTGKEIGAIQWRHVDDNFHNEANGLYYIRLDLPHRKKERPWADDHVLVSKDFQTHLDGLKKLTRHTEPNDYLFCGPDGSRIQGFSESFRYFLEDADMRYMNDDPTKGRALYSLRHYYATQRIARERVSREVLSKHMATGISMLEKFYVDVAVADDAELVAPSFKVVEEKSSNGLDLDAIKKVMEMDVDDAIKERLIAAL